MYCPNCEFEIKQEVTDCPICGGELTQYPAEGPNASTSSDGSEEKNMSSKKPLDTCISDLILDAKHELDSLDSTPGSSTQPIEPSSSSLDFESMLSEDSNETAQPTAEPFIAEPPVPSAMPDAPPTNEEPFLLNETASPFMPETDAPVVSEPPIEQNQQPESIFSDDKLFIDETTAPTGTPDTDLFVPVTDAPLMNETPIEQSQQPESLFSDDKLFIDETTAPTETPDTDLFIPETDAPLMNETPIEQSQQPESLFSDDKLFIDETTAPTGTPDTEPFINESPKQGPEIPRDSTTPPPGEQSFEQPWSLQELSAQESTETTNFIPEEQAEQPDAAPTNGLNFLDIEEAGSSEAAENQSTGSRSKKRLIFLLLFGVLLIAGAYTLQDYVVQFFESKQIKKPTPTRIIPKAAVKKPLTPAQSESQAPTDDLQKTTEPVGAPQENTQQQIPAAQTELQAPSRDLPSKKTQKPEPATPEDSPVDGSREKTIQKSIVVLEEKPATTSKPIQNSGVPAIVPEKKQPPAQSNYTIHVASFKAQQIAGEEVEGLLKLGFDAYLETADLGEKGIWHRVKVGHYATRADAEQTVKSIQQKKPGIKPLIYRDR